MSNLIVILTDFGDEDGYVGVIKGVCLKKCPNVQFIDLSNQIPSQSIEDAALSQSNLYDEMGLGTDIAMFYSDGTLMNITIKNVVEHDGYITFDVILNAPEIDKIFAKLRDADHGSIIKLGLPDSNDPVEAIIFEPGDRRPNGYESGVFVSVPSEADKVYYLDPEASREQGRLILKVLPSNAQKEKVTPEIDRLLAEFEHIRRAPDVKRGGGTAGEACSKGMGVVDVG